MSNDINLAELRRLRQGGAVVMGRDDVKMLERIQSTQDAQVELAKQQLRNNIRQMDANREAQHRANEQWHLVFAADLYKFHRQCEKDGVAYDAELDGLVKSAIRVEFQAESETNPNIAQESPKGFVVRETVDEVE